MDLLFLLWWISDLTRTGDVLNGHLYSLPPELQEHLIAIGLWIAKMLGWA
jgi:hypothetical protein